MNGEQSGRGWGLAGISLSVLLILTLVVYHESVSYLTGLWNQLSSGEYGHGYLVLAISAYLVITRRRTLLQQAPCPEYWGLIGVVVANLIWLLAALADVQVVQAASTLAMLASIVWVVLGGRLFLKLLFPILFIGFAIPVWFPLSPLLQELTADAVFQVVRVLGVPALREQHIITVPAGQLSIEEACSGLRYLLAALTLGTLYAYLNYTTLRSRVTVVLVAAGAAVLANILRVFIVVYLAYATDMQHPLIRDHLSLGWYLFGGLVFVLLYIDARLHRRDTAEHNNIESGEESRRVGKTDCRADVVQYSKVIIPALVLIISGPAMVWWVENQAAAGTRVVGFEFPAGAHGWSGPGDTQQDWMPVFNGAVSEKRVYTKGSRSVQVYVGYYAAQKQDRELINDRNHIADGKRWKSLNPRGRARAFNDRVVLEQQVYHGRQNRLLVWYWYVVAGQPVTSRYQAKLYQAMGAFTDERGAAVLAVATEQVDDEPGAARKVLRDFLSTVNRPMSKLVTPRFN